MPRHDVGSSRIRPGVDFCVTVCSARRALPTGSSECSAVRCTPIARLPRRPSLRVRVDYLGEWSVRFTAPPVVSVGPTSVLRCERAGKFQSVTIGLKRDSRVAVPLLEPEVIDRWHLRAKKPQLRSTAYPCGAPRRRIAIGAKRVGHLMKAAGIRPHPPTHS